MEEVWQGEREREREGQQGPDCRGRDVRRLMGNGKNIIIFFKRN